MLESDNLRFRKFLMKLIVFSMPFHDLASPIPLLNLTLFILLIYFFTSSSVLLNSYFGKIYSVQKPIIILVVLYMWIAIISFMEYNPLTNFSFSFFRQFPMYLLSMFLITDAIIDRIISFKEILLSFINGFTLMTILFYLGIGLSLSEDGRATIFGINQNAVAIYSNIAVLFIINYIHNFQITKPKRIYYYLLIPAFIKITIMTASRGGFLSLLLGVGLYFISRNSGTLNRIKNIFTASIILGILTFVFLSDEILYNRLFESDEGGAIEDRTIIWEAVYEMISNNLLFGIGLFKYETEITRVMGRFRATHNEYLTIVVYSGIIGLAQFLYFIFKSTVVAFKTYRTFDNPLFLSLTGILIFTLFKAGGSLTSLLIWFMFAFVLASETILKYKK
jgi:hypothetical protein